MKYQVKTIPGFDSKYTIDTNGVVKFIDSYGKHKIKNLQFNAVKNPIYSFYHNKKNKRWCLARLYIELFLNDTFKQSHIYSFNGSYKLKDFKYKLKPSRRNCKILMRKHYKKQNNTKKGRNSRKILNASYCKNLTDGYIKDLIRSYSKKRKINIIPTPQLINAWRDRLKYQRFKKEITKTI